MSGKNYEEEFALVRAACHSNDCACKGSLPQQ